MQGWRFPSLSFLALAALVGLAVGTVFAETPAYWSARGAGGGGGQFSPSISPHDARRLYVACDMSELFSSADGGKSWQPVHFREIRGGGLTAPVQFSPDPRVLYALDQTEVPGGDAGTPAKSTDGGASWNWLPGDPTGHEAWALYSDPDDADNVLVSSYSKIFFSDDEGAAFHEVYEDATGNGAAIVGAFFDGDDIYVGTNAGLLESHDAGASFLLSTAGGIPPGEAMTSFSGAKEQGQVRLYCVTGTDSWPGITGSDFWGYRGVYSLDIGEGGWVRRTGGMAPGDRPFFVGTARTDIDAAWVAGGGDNSVPIVYVTRDGGVSWSSTFEVDDNRNIDTGWAGRGGDEDWWYGEYALGLAVSPVDPSFAVFTDLGFTHLTRDGGASWQQAYVVPTGQNPRGAPTPKGRSYRSTGLEVISGWWLTWTSPSRIIGSVSDIKMIRSTDEGWRWSVGSAGHDLNTMYHTVLHPGTGVLYAATSSVHDLYESTYLQDARIDGGSGLVLSSADEGSSWQVVHDFHHPVVWLALDPARPNRLYASVVHSVEGGIYVSDDIDAGAGSSWRRLALPTRTEGHPLTLHILDDGTLVATYSGRRDTNGAFTASSGVFVSADEGSSWIDRSDPGMQYWTRDLVVDSHDSGQNTWYVGVYSGWGGPPNGLGGLYRTTDRGVSWERISTLDRVSSCAVNPSDSEEMFVATEVDGLWHTSNLGAAAPLFEEVAGYPFQHPQRIFWNPHQPAELWVTSFGNGLTVGHLEGSNADADPREDHADCAPVDSTLWSPPSPARSLVLSGASPTLFAWTPPEEPGADAPVYDLLRASDPASFFVGGECLESGIVGTSTEDSEPPSPGAAYFYLVRSINACDSALAGDRLGPPCPQ